MCVEDDLLELFFVLFIFYRNLVDLMLWYCNIGNWVFVMFWVNVEFGELKFNTLLVKFNLKLLLW